MNIKIPRNTFKIYPLVWVPMGTGYQPEKIFWVPMGTGQIKNCGYRLVSGSSHTKLFGYWVPARKMFWVPMGTGYWPEKFFWVPMGTGYRPKFQRCRPLVQVFDMKNQSSKKNLSTTPIVIKRILRWSFS